MNGSLHQTKLIPEELSALTFYNFTVQVINNAGLIKVKSVVIKMEELGELELHFQRS